MATVLSWRSEVLGWLLREESPVGAILSQERARLQHSCSQCVHRLTAPSMPFGWGCAWSI